MCVCVCVTCTMADCLPVLYPWVTALWKRVNLALNLSVVHVTENGFICEFEQDICASQQ